MNVDGIFVVRCDVDGRIGCWYWTADVALKSQYGWVRETDRADRMAAETAVALVLLLEEQVGRTGGFAEGSRFTIEEVIA